MHMTTNNKIQEILDAQEELIQVLREIETDLAVNDRSSDSL